ncbi:hypothetical protein [Calothrix sp. UHCC 0171]|uniref:hypothetical protein n=1 Tax=Calothrix sp. UHCC 0171 TaxID=3110245 RepID=UPI002B1F92F1|nr:hypothetical protein [Calothrix sp. UHCC 0171]MEA5573266.1 hypothetical protein [Calothrix sp. UHCC 0171]
MDIKLGFGSIPRVQYVFVSREGDVCWYMLAEDEKQIPIYDKGLTGIITGIECNKSVETKFGLTSKTDLAILADKPYVIRSGRESIFSKSLLLSLDALTIEQLRNPLTIAVSPGDKTVVFCNVYDPTTYRVVDFSWNGHREIDLQALEERVTDKISRVAANSGQNITHGELRLQMMTQIDKYLTQLAWKPEQGRRYLQQHYGKTSRRQLSDSELLDFTFRVMEMAGVMQNVYTQSSSPIDIDKLSRI